VATSLRQRKKTETRRALASAALRLAADRGPDGVTVDEISAAADVSPRTFFNYFPSKEEAILGIDPDRRAELRARLTSRPPTEPPLEALRATLVGHAIAYADDASEWALRARLSREHAPLFRSHVASFADFERELVEIVTERLGESDVVDPGLYPSLVVTVAFTAMRVALDRWSTSGEREDLADVLGTAFDHLAVGLRPPSG
jgi:AcrR family transcriptional regulator